MENSLVPGLRHAINTFTPSIDIFSQSLEEARRQDAPTYITEYLRGCLHGYALTVGGLKVELAKAEGTEWAPLFVAHSDWKNASEEADEIHDQFADAISPATAKTLERDWEEAKRRADAAVIKYAMA